MIVDFALLATPLSIIGARTYYVIFQWEQYRDNPISALYVWQGGIAMYGCIIGGIIAALIFAKWKKIPLLELLDISAPSLVLGQAIGRWGNFFNQEAFGIPLANESFQFFPFMVYIQSVEKSVYGPWRTATFFYESMACFAIFIFLMIYKNKSKQRGNVFISYAFFYGIARSLIEGLRTDSLYIGPLRVSQILSVVLFAVCGVTLFVRSYNAWRLEDEVDPNLIVMPSLLKEKEEEAAQEEAESIGPETLEDETTEAEPIEEAAQEREPDAEDGAADDESGPEEREANE
jgi:phosphatidylglycerol:prolipoprotein diacylglycerol transferase